MSTVCALRDERDDEEMILRRRIRGVRVWLFCQALSLWLTTLVAYLWVQIGEMFVRNCYNADPKYVMSYASAWLGWYAIASIISTIVGLYYGTGGDAA